MIDEQVTLPGIILNLIAVNGGKISKAVLHTKLSQFSERDVDEVLTFLTYKSLIDTLDHKPTDCTIVIRS